MQIVADLGGVPGRDCRGYCKYCYFKKVKPIEALGCSSCPPNKISRGYAAVRFIFDEDDISALNRILDNEKDLIIEYKIEEKTNKNISDSSQRNGYYLMYSKDLERIIKYLPKTKN